MKEACTVNAKVNNKISKKFRIQKSLMGFCVWGEGASKVELLTKIWWKIKKVNEFNLTKKPVENKVNINSGILKRKWKEGMPGGGYVVRAV